MMYEYKVVPAPTRGKKAKGLKTPADRFANALSEVMNEVAAEGWDYLRTDTLPAEERQGLTGRTTVFQNMLVFRRVADVAEDLATDGADDEIKVAPPAPTLKTAVDEIARTHAPKLPSADQAQELPESKPAKVASPAGRDVAAE